MLTIAVVALILYYIVCIIGLRILGRKFFDKLKNNFIICNALEFVGALGVGGAMLLQWREHTIIGWCVFGIALGVYSMRQTGRINLRRLSVLSIIQFVVLAMACIMNLVVIGVKLREYGGVDSLIHFDSRQYLMENNMIMLLSGGIGYMLTIISVTSDGDNRLAWQQMIIPTYTIIGNVVAYNVFQFIWKNGYQSQRISEGFQYFYTSWVESLNVMIVISICLVFVFALGLRLGSVVNIMLVGFVVLANLIKIKYHNNFFTWMDMLQAKEAILMGKEFLNIYEQGIIIILLGGAIALIIWQRKRILRFFKPTIAPGALLASCIIAALLISNVYHDGFKDEGIFIHTWENRKVNVYYNGIFANLLMEAREFSKIIMDEPRNYSHNETEKLKESFRKLKPEEKTSEIKPDIILILAESTFDMSKLPQINLSEEIFQTVSAYSDIELISPRFGGYTSAVEWETLTGLSLAFLPDDIVPYTTYYNSSKQASGGVVYELKKNGYQTKAIHPNDANFYNRAIVYENLGFDEYHSIVQFFDVPSELKTANGWVKDEYLAEYTTQELEKSDAPSFVFLITEEEHYVTQNKYENPEIEVWGDDLTEADVNVLTQQAQAYRNTDKMIEYFIEYMNNTERPTLLYVYGDHLPPMSYLKSSGYVSDLSNKYTTSFVRYSNYKKLDKIADRITPNQIAAFIMHDSEICHSGYFDYIYSLQKEYPVIHKEFVDITASDFDIYKYIQYDLMFGNKDFMEEKTEE